MKSVMIHRHFNAAQACAIAGVSRRRLDYWDRQGIAKPSVASARGRGSRRLYSFTNLVELVTVRNLREGGMSLQKIRRALAWLRGHWPDLGSPFAGLVFLTDGETLFVMTRSEREAFDALRRGQRVFSVCLDKFIETVDRSARSVSMKWVERIEVDGMVWEAELEGDERDGGYVISVPGLPGCISQGETVSEAKQMIADAIRAVVSVKPSARKRGRKRRVAGA